jgi:hypothetical protein
MVKGYKTAFADFKEFKRKDGEMPMEEVEKNL